MALHFNKLERPGKGQLLIRQTWLEPVLKILRGGAIMGMGVFSMVTTTSGGKTKSLAISELELDRFEKNESKREYNVI